MDLELVALLSGGVSIGFAAAFVLTAPRSRKHVCRRSTLDDLIGQVRASPMLREWARRGELERRRAACLGEMPEFLDILTLGLTAGLSFDASLELYCESFDNSLARMFGEAMAAWRMGLSSRSSVLQKLADDMGIQALRSFSSVVSAALEFGTPLSAALERQAQGIRDEQRAEVEESIEKVPVKMLIPMGTLIVPAMLLAILGPLLGSAVGIG